MSLSPEVRAVAFDLDDTFWDCAPAIERAESVLNDWLRREAPEVLARHEAVPMLERRKAPQYKVAAITNGNADLAQIGIADRFDIILRATLEVPAKPDVAMFRLALDHFGLAPDSMVHVGDSPTTDVAGAQAAGVPAVWFNQSAQAWSGPAPAPDYTVHSIAQLRTLLLD